MKKNKFLYMISAFALACIISFSGVGGSYIQAKASSGITDVLWNDNATAWENIERHALLWSNWAGAFIEPSLVGEMFAVRNSIEFYNYMISEGYTEEQAEETVHGGGGHVRDGISMDDNGNVTYSDEVSDLFHGFILDYLDSNSGYVLYKTPTVNDMPTMFFTDSIARENFKTTIDNLGLAHVKWNSNSNGGIRYIPYDYLYVPNCQTIKWVNRSLVVGVPFMSTGAFVSSNNANLRCYVIEDDWSYHKPYCLSTVKDSSDSDFCWFYFSDTSYSLSDVFVTESVYADNYLGVSDSDDFFNTLISNDGRVIKLWYDLNAFKNYDIGNQMYYVTDSFNNYDSTIDNSTTITSQEYAYYNDNSTTIYQTIQNNIDNSGNSDLTEKDVQDIVDAAVQDIKDSIADSGNQGGNDSGDSDNSGNGVGDLVGGIGKLLDTILSLIGKVMGVVADFTQSILDLFTGFTDFTDGFSNFLSGAFSFIPQEIWNVIQVGLSLMILLAVIKFLRK